MNSFTNLVGVIIISFLGLLLLSFLLSYPIYLLWNGCLVGAVSGVNEVTWLQAWGLSVLTGMLFKTSTTKSE